MRTRGQDSGEQLGSFFLTANVNDLSKGSKVHPQNGGRGRKLDQESGDEESSYSAITGLDHFGTPS